MSLVAAAAAVQDAPDTPATSTARPGAPPPVTQSHPPGTAQDKSPEKPVAESAKAADPAAPLPPIYDPAEYGEVDPKTGRPANVPSKYWDYDKREVKWGAVLTQHNWLQKKVGERREKPPEQYALTADETFTPPEGLDKDPVYAGLATFAREELELSQNQWDSMIRRYWSLMATSGQEITTAEIASLGEGGAARVNRLAQGLAANLSPENYQEAVKDIQRAGSVAWIEQLLGASLPPALEKGGEAQGSGDTDETLYQMQTAKDEYGQPKMAGKEYAANYRRRLAAHLDRKARSGKA